MQRHHHSFLILGIIISLLNLTVCTAKTELTRAKASGPAQPNFRTVLKEGLGNKAAFSSVPGRQMVRHHAEETEFESLPALAPAGGFKFEVQLS